MASIRIHEDQENRIGDNRRGKENDALSGYQGHPLQQGNKRSVLAVLHNNCHRNAKPEFPSKDEKYCKPKTFVAQQPETFKIYEEINDNATIKVYEDKLVSETSVVLRESRETRIKQTTEIILKTELEKPVLDDVDNSINLADIVPPYRYVSPDNKENDTYSPVIPMSLEKSLQFLDSTSKLSSKSKREATKSRKDSFYDVDEYRSDILNYLRTAETRHRPKPGYMRKQPDITYSMRAILVDWLVEVAEEYRLHSETLYLAVSYIDRFLSFMSVVRAKLQLVGTAAMFIAAKYEEIYPPDVGEFVYITDDTYSKKQVLRMEHLILRVLSFDLTVPTPLTFIRDFCISHNFSDKVMYLAMYLSELSMLEADPYLHFLPSHLAASAIALARHTLQEEIWPHELELSSGYCLKDLRQCIKCLTKTFANAPDNPQQAIQEKYKNSKYGHVAQLLPRSSEPLSSDEDSESA